MLVKTKEFKCLALLYFTNHDTTSYSIQSRVKYTLGTKQILGSSHCDIQSIDFLYTVRHYVMKLRECLLIIKGKKVRRFLGSVGLLQTIVFQYPRCIFMPYIKLVCHGGKTQYHCVCVCEGSCVMFSVHHERVYS